MKIVIDNDLQINVNNHLLKGEMARKIKYDLFNDTMLNPSKHLKKDKRKKYILVIDVETAGSLNQPLIYDLGCAVMDKKGKIYYKSSFIIKDIFKNSDLMNGAYYKNKIPKYKDDIRNGDHLYINFANVLQVLKILIDFYNIDTITAYNLAFDKKAIEHTSKYLNLNLDLFNNKEMLCIWSYACEVIFTQKSFYKMAIKHGWVSEKNNLLTNAEICYRYISKDIDFLEEHTGLADVLIECKILAKCIAQKKKHNSGILPHPWRIPNKFHKEN